VKNGQSRQQQKQKDSQNNLHQNQPIDTEIDNIEVIILDFVNTYG